MGDVKVQPVVALLGQYQMASSYLGSKAPHLDSSCLSLQRLYCSNVVCPTMAPAAAGKPARAAWSSWRWWCSAGPM